METHCACGLLAEVSLLASETRTTFAIYLIALCKIDAIQKDREE
jgi:hypothetical protein